MNNRRVRFIALLLLGGIFMGVTHAEPRRVVLDRVVAVVGSSSILLSEVTGYAEVVKQRQRSGGYTSDRDPMVESLEELMTQKLMANQARVDSLEVNLLDITMRVEDQISQMREIAGGTKELEREQNMEIFNIRDVLRRRYEEQSYAQMMKYSISNKVSIVPGEVEQYYKNQDTDDLPTIGEQYQYAQITRFPSSMEEAKMRVKERLLEMRERVISGGMKFSSLARMYSADPGSAYRGGEMEPSPSSAYTPPFAEALELLKPGQISEIVETEFGYHIIELIDKQGNLYHCRHILLRPTFTTEETMEPINFLDSLANEIRLGEISFEEAAKLHSDDAGSKMNGGIVTNHDLLDRYNANDAKLTVTRFLKEDFGSMGYKSLDDYNALRRLKEGEVSAPFSTEDILGNTMAKILKLVDVIPAHQASLENDYLELESLALEDKQNRVFSDWLRRHIRSTYVYIDPEFRDRDYEYEEWVR